MEPERKLNSISPGSHDGIDALEVILYSMIDSSAEPLTLLPRVEGELDRAYALLLRSATSDDGLRRFDATKRQVLERCKKAIWERTSKGQGVQLHISSVPSIPNKATPIDARACGAAHVVKRGKLTLIGDAVPLPNGSFTPLSIVVSTFGEVEQEHLIPYNGGGLASFTRAAALALDLADQYAKHYLDNKRE